MRKQTESNVKRISIKPTGQKHGAVSIRCKKTFQSEVDIPGYASRIRAMLVMKDILSHEYMDHVKKKRNEQKT